ncbi:hypothetical protein [Reyranella sp.]|uniref:hypothetical protein n=1 Tax=Reyranella sp. TaxID=1929291 RepID=UPI00273183D0|nr:hypothetical protein [Reyranella sp.]MDP2377798.1 hypothetical protein [Reyranella sp.]
MSLDPESLLGIKSEVLKAAVSASLLGVLWRRQFKLAEALSSIAAGMGSAIWIAPAALAHSGIEHEDVRAGIIFGVGLVGTHIFAAVTTYAPELLRRVLFSRYGFGSGYPPPTDQDKPSKPEPGADA